MTAELDDIVTARRAQLDTVETLQAIGAQPHHIAAAAIDLAADANGRPPKGWWATSIGKAALAAIHDDDTRLVSTGEAAAILDVGASWIWQLCQREQLIKIGETRGAGDGGVTLGSLAKVWRARNGINDPVSIS